MEPLDEFRRTTTGLALADSTIVQIVNERLSEQEKLNDIICAKLNDVFCTKIIEVLDKNDAARAEIIKRLDQIAPSSCAPAIIRAVDGSADLARGSQNIPTQLSTAIQKFEEVSLIHLGEVELEARASVYASAEATSEDTQELYMEARDKCSEADRKLLQAQQSFESVLKQGDQLVIRAEIANREALEACATAAKRLEEANAALEQVTDKAKKAANIYSDAQLQREAAVESYDRAMQKLAAAEEIVKSSTTQIADAKTATESVLDSLRNAENEANKAITLAMGAGTKAQLAEEELRKSERLMRRARSWSLVTLIAAISIATWGVVRAAANLHYGNVAPIAVTAIAVVVGIVVWRSER